MQNQLPQELQVKTELTDPPQVIISDGFLDRYKEQCIAIEVSKIQKIQGSIIAFTSGRKEAVDEIVFATGYKTSLPYFSRDILQKLYFDPTDSFQPLLLHQATFAEQIDNIGFVGMYRGPYFGVIELQARWVNMVFSKKIPAPTPQELRAGIQQEQMIRQLVPRPQFPHGDYVMFAESIAKAIGILPNWEQLKTDNPRLHELLWTKPFLLSHYHEFGNDGLLQQTQIDAMVKQVSSLNA